MTLRHRRSSTFAAITAVTMACLLSISPLAAQSPLRSPASAGFDTNAAKADPVIKELGDIARDLARRALGPQSDRAALAAAYRAGDELRVRALLGLTPVEEAELSARMTRLSGLLLERYPQLRELQKAVKTDCPECRMATAARLLEMPRPMPGGTLASPRPASCSIATVLTEPSDDAWLDEPPTSGPVVLATAEDDGCAWLPYTAALALCTALGPILYWACAIVAYCEFCAGETRDALCSPIMT